jgi:hypothetical protein
MHAERRVVGSWQRCRTKLLLSWALLAMRMSRCDLVQCFGEMLIVLFALQMAGQRRDGFGAKS